MNKFKELGLSEKITDVLEELKFEVPSEIQAKTIPLILKGKDIIGIASTGSGKTLAFASGIIEKITPGKGIQALVLTPTRELADQIAKVIKMFSKKTYLKVCEIYGGVGYDKQLREVKHADIVVGTPGRLLDHLQKKSFDFFDVKFLVLDEADRMADMGFLPDVEKIIGQCPIKRQTMLFSATTSQDVDFIAKKFMREPIQIAVKKYVDSSKLKQYYFDTPNHLKFSLLVDLLKKEKSEKVLVFCNTRRNADLVASNLKRYKIESLVIHGRLVQKRRSKIIELFHSNEANILVCTDVAARGLDIKGISHIYNYDIPKSSEEYIHRIGRTARAGTEGMAISIVTSKDYENFRKVLEDSSLKIELKEMPKVERLTPHFKDNDLRSGIRSRGRYQHKGRNNSRRFPNKRPNRNQNSHSRRPRGRR
jgi:ATP-dependent RNA helicase DeaD